MASQALYRRYRSQTFDELIGQEHIVQTLRNALAEGRIAHAYLFTGPRGVGKTTVARLLAKAVNCTAEQQLRPCGECDSCRAIADGRAVDVIEMDAASHTSVEDAREIIERVQFRPTSGTYKVYIIDETHMLSTAAFNALLKTLEEPPGHALFILATTEIHKVPATILSRCQRFTFSRHTVTATAAHLQRVAAEEQIRLEPGVPEAIARAATGSMRDALSVLDQLMAYGGDAIRLDQVRGLLGATEAQEVSALADALVGGDLSGALRTLNAVAEQGADLRQFARDVVERLRALMLLKASGDSGLLDMTEDDLAALERQAAATDLGALLGWVKLFSGLDHQLRTSAYGQLPLELAIVEAIAAPAVAAPARAATPAPVRSTPRPSVASQPTAVSAPAPTPSRPTPAPTPSRPAPVPAQTAPASPPRISEPPVEPHYEVPGAPTPARPQELLPAERPRESEPEEVLAAPVREVDSAEIASDNAAVALLERVEELWPLILRDIKADNPAAQALIKGARLADVEGNIVVIEFKFPKHVEMFQKRTTLQVVEQVISKLMGGNYGVRGVVAEQRKDDPRTLREQIKNARKDPLIKKAINIFDADIIDVEQE